MPGPGRRSDPDRDLAPAGCEPGLGSYLGIVLNQGDDIFLIMAFLPFAVGLLVSTPIVAKELESGTAQTAWSLNGSRARWLRRQVWPIATCVSIAVALAAITTDLLARDYLTTGGLALPLLGLHGLPVLARFLAALGLGLLIGSVVPRTLAALVIGGLLCLTLYVGISQALDVWIDAQDASARMEGETRLWTFNGDWQWLAPDGRLITAAEVSDLVPDDLEQADVGLIQPFYTAEWLEERGYQLLPLGIPESEAIEGWYPYDMLLFSIVGVIGIAAAFVVVDRRRPT